MKTNLIEDLSVLTGVSKYNLIDLANLSVDVISHDINESILQHESVTEINIGIGTLLITNQDNSIKYKFIPSKTLENNVYNSYQKQDTLELKVDKVLGERINKTYKDLF